MKSLSGAITLRRKNFIRTAVLLTAAALFQSLVPASLYVSRLNVPVEAGGRQAVAQSSDTLNCGYDELGSDDADLLHYGNVRAQRANRLSREDESSLRPGLSNDELQATNVGDVALIHDDGSIILSPNKFDLKKRSLLFTPTEGGYRLSREPISFEKDGGFALGYFFGIDGTPGGDDNGYREVILQRPFPFFGSNYDRIFVGTNGYITFNEGDTTARPSAAALTSQLPRIAPLWADLDVGKGGAIFINELPDRTIVTWRAVSQAVFTGKSTFQTVLYEDGRIAFVYKKVKARPAIVGISPGRFDQESVAVDLSEPPAGTVSGVYESFTNKKRLDIPALTRAFFRTNSDSFDFLYVWTDFEFDNGIGLAHAFNIRNDISGIGLPIFDRGAVYGSENRLSTIVIMGNFTDWPADPDQNRAGLFSGIGIACHELGHRWLAYVRFHANADIRDDLLGRGDSHWSFFADSRTNSEGTNSSVMEGNAWSDNGNGIFTSTQLSANHFSELDQYLMGLRGANEVGNLPYLVVTDRSKAYLRTSTPASNFPIGAVRRHTTVDRIIEHEGPRIPSSEEAPRLFRAGFILLSEQNSTPGNAKIDHVDRYRRSLVRYFSVATGRRASLDSSLDLP